MMGKVLGVGLVGLTQIGIWMILMPLIFFIASSLLGIDAANMEGINTGNLPTEELMMSSNGEIAQVLAEIQGMNWYLILPLTLFYFIAGYFAYAALFAAVGSAVGEDINEAQSLTLPIMMPLVCFLYRH